MIQIISEQHRIDRKKFLSLLRPVAARLALKGRIVIRLGDGIESQRLNRTYRGKDEPTDVLSFPMNEDLPDGRYVGDILICLPVAETQAIETGHSLERELLMLMIHGILHLAGYDHELDQGRMMALQTELLATIPEEF
jgi:probable rRNA maturation factor